jgi:hypothetical protein
VSTFDAAMPPTISATRSAISRAESTRDAQGNYLEAIRHCGFPVEALRADEYGP